MSTEITQDEQILITDKPHNIKKLIIIFSIITISIIIFLFSIHFYIIDKTTETSLTDTGLKNSTIQSTYHAITPDNGQTETSEDKVFIESVFEYIISLFKDKFVEFLLFNIVPVIFFELLFTLGVKNSKFVLSNKRIFGKNIFGKKFDLPINDIQSTSFHRLSNGLSVATSSGNINLYFLKNSDEIYNKINELIASQQNNNNNTLMQNTLNDTKLLKEYKDLLDSGVITQEEFEAKKKQILNI